MVVAPQKTAAIISHKSPMSISLLYSLGLPLKTRKMPRNARMSPTPFRIVKRSFKKKWAPIVTTNGERYKRITARDAFVYRRP